MAALPSPSPMTQYQIPDHSIMDYFYKQNYLGNAFAYVLETSTSTTAETPFLLIQNPATSGKALFLPYQKLISRTASHNVLAKFYLSPVSPVAGTAAAQYNLRPAMPTSSVVTLTSAPSTSSNGHLIMDLFAASLADFGRKMPVIDPGQNLLVTMTPDQNAVAFSLDLSWYEL